MYWFSVDPRGRGVALALALIGADACGDPAPGVGSATTGGASEGTSGGATTGATTGDTTGEGGPSCDPEGPVAGTYASQPSAPGFFVDGAAACERPRLVGVGDFNGDGLADLVLETEGHQAYVVFGRAASGRFFLSSALDGVGGVVIAPGAQAPTGWRAIGDVNGDGRVDLAASSALPQTLIVFGTGESAPIDLDAIAGGGPGGARVDHGSLGTGSRIDAIVEVSGDGLGDLAFAGDGAVQALFGAAALASPSLAAAAQGEGGFADEVSPGGECWPVAVGPAGDFDGDGLGDLVARVRYACGSAESGFDRAMIVRGRGDGAPPPGSVELGHTLYGAQAIGDGDVDGDGLADVVVVGAGGPFTHPFIGLPADGLEIYYGRALGPGPALVGPGFRAVSVPGEGARGMVLRGLRDLRGDGRADLLLEVEGSTYLVFGPDPADAESGAIDLELTPAIDAALGVRLAYAGAVGLADLGGDGIGDLAFAGPAADGAEPASGRVELLRGRAGWSGGEAPDFAAAGERAGDRFGEDVAAADVNGDGLADLIISAPRADPQGPESGRIYVIFGPLP